MPENEEYFDFVAGLEPTVPDDEYYDMLAEEYAAEMYEYADEKFREHYEDYQQSNIDWDENPASAPEELTSTSFWLKADDNITIIFNDQVLSEQVVRELILWAAVVKLRSVDTAQLVNVLPEDIKVSAAYHAVKMLNNMYQQQNNKLQLTILEREVHMAFLDEMVGETNQHL